MSTGIYGSKAVIGGAKGAFKGTAKGIGRFTTRKGRELAARPAEKISEKLKTSRFAQSKVGGWLVGKAAKAPNKILRAQAKATAEAEKKFEHMTSGDVKNIFAGLNPTDRIGATRVLGNRGELSKGGTLSDKRIKGSLRLAARYGLETPLLKNRPDLASMVKKRPSEIISKIQPADAGKIQIESLADKKVLEEIFKQFRPSHFNNIANTNIKAMNQLQEAINDFGKTDSERETKLSAINPALARYVKSNAGQNLGWNFGKEAISPKPASAPEPEPILAAGTEKEFKKVRGKRPGPERKPFG